MEAKTCEHQDASLAADLNHQQVCVECEKIGSEWVHLRTCTECGNTHCCDSSVHQHARRHHEQTGHPVIQSAEPGEFWYWCYLDELYFKPQS